MTAPQVSAAITRWNHAADKPTDVSLRNLIKVDRAAIYRPWFWLRDVMSLASANGEHDLVCAGLFWAWHWQQVLAPSVNGNFVEFLMQPDIPRDLRIDIVRIGRSSALALPAEQRIVGDETGTITAGMLADAADDLK